jgi:hypothetical protein
MIYNLASIGVIQSRLPNHNDVVPTADSDRSC